MDRKKANYITDILLILLFHAAIYYIIPGLTVNHTFVNDTTGESLIRVSLFKSFSNTELWSVSWRTLLQLPVFLLGCVCARYDLTGKLKRRFSNNYLYTVLAVIVFFLSFTVRYKQGDPYDHICAPIAVICFTIILNNGPGRYISRLLRVIGRESTMIWLIHVFYCDIWCQNIVFLPRYSLLIAAFLLILSYTTGKVIEWLFSILHQLYSKTKGYFEFS